VIVVGKLEYDTPGEVEVLTVPKPSSRLMRFLWQPWRCLWAMRWHRTDIIHFHDAEMLITLPLAKLWWWRSRFIYDVHEDFANILLVKDWLPLWIKPVVRVLTHAMEKGLASLADAIVGVTPPLVDKFGNQRRITAYNYTSRAFFEQAEKAIRKPQKRKFDLVHIGTLNLRRAVFLADTIREFHQLRPSARSLVIGVSPDSEAADKIEATMRLRIPDGCVLLGRTPHEELPGLLANAKVGLDVHPWLWSNLKVALPVKVCEYMAAGCAVVASALPVLNQILQEAGVDATSITLIEGGDPIDYAKAIVRMVEAIESGADPGAGLREVALKHMVWEGEAVKIAQLYLKILEKICAT
jgi:glycosyltransferase involved in cell wall biosynthesis